MNIYDIRRQSHRLNQQQMIDWIAKNTGHRPSISEFEHLMRKALPKESYYQERIIRFLRQTYPAAFVWKAAAGPCSRQGIPDVCAIIDGQFFGFEIKRPYIGRISKMQERTMQDIRNAGGIAAVVSFWHQAKDIIDKRKQSAYRNGGIGNATNCK